MKKCYYAKKCGGCAYIHEEYENQLIEKQKSVQALFPRTKVSPIVGMDNPYHYRHKVYATFGYKEDGLVHAGMYEENSHNLIFAKDCLIQHNIANHIIQTICDIANKLHIEPYNEDTQYGVLRHAYVRVSHATNKALVVIVIGSKELPGSKTFVKELLEKEPRISSIVLNYNRKDTSLILGDTDKVLYGPGYITDTIHNIEFRISPKSFYQINPVQTEKLYSIAIELANLKKTDNVLDACCGIGTISLCAAKSVSSVTCVEISKDAIKDAIYNAKKNHINNAYFYAGDAGEFIDSLIDKPDVVFLDPPRSGMSKQAIDALVRLKTSRIVYISCNPETQARDVKQLIKEGYHINKIVPVDLFPYTKHVESIVLLSHKSLDSHIDVKVEFGEGEEKVPLDKIAERAKQHQPVPKATYKMIQEYVEKKYGFKVHTAYIAEVKRELGLSMYDASNAAEGLRQPRKHPTQEKVNAIKDALNYFNLL